MADKKKKISAKDQQEIEKWNKKLRDPNLSEKSRAHITKRIKFLGGTPLTSNQPGAKPGKTPLTPDEVKAQNIQDLVGPGAAGAKDLAEAFYAEGSLGKVSEGMEEYTDPQTGETKYKRVDETQKPLDDMQALATKYGERSPEMAEAIEMNKGRLAGYDAPEFQAMREQGQRSIDRQYQGALRQAAQSQARGGVRGASAGAQNLALDRSRMQAQGDVEQDLFVRGAEEKRRALGDYTNLIGNTTQAEYQRGLGSQQAYASQLGKQRQDELERAQFNLGQVGAENAGRAGTYFGGLAAGEARAGRKSQDKLSKYLIRTAQRRA